MDLILPKVNYEDVKFKHSFERPIWNQFQHQTIYANLPGDKKSYVRDDPRTGEPIHHNVGTAQWETGTGKLNWIETDENYRRRGVATHILRKARELQAAHGLPDIVHTGVRHEDGSAWAKSTGLYVPPIASGVCRDCQTLRKVNGACDCTPGFNGL